MTTNLLAKPVVKNKYWIVEESGNKVATIQAVEGGHVAYVHDNKRELFPSIKLLSKQYNIEFVKTEKSKKDHIAYDVYGYPTTTFPHNEVFDVRRRLPIYTKSSKSKSFFCAGYYIIKFNKAWVRATCPKLITINRYEYQGPFRSTEETNSALKVANG
jgi:hypothetical protein